MLSKRRARSIPVLLWIVCSLAISACHPFAGQPFDPASIGQLRAIAISVPPPKLYDVESSAVSIAGLVDGHPSTSDQGTLDSAVRGIGFHLDREIEAALQNEFTAHGLKSFSFDIVPNSDGHFDPAETSTTSADAILFVDTRVAMYGNDVLDKTYIPFEIITVRMINPKNNVDIYKQTFMYHPTMTEARDVVILRADSKYSFASYDMLLSNPKLASEGFAAVAQPLAQAVVDAVMR